MLSTQLKILRIFGLPSEEVTAVLRAAKEEGCPGLRLLERDGEYAVCVQVSAPTKEMAEAHCDRWVQKLSARFGDAVYGYGEISLAQAALNALLQKRKLLAAADETTGRLLGTPLQALSHSESVFDFGSETWANPERAGQLGQMPGWLKKYPGDVVQAAAARAINALGLGGADLAAMYMPATVGQAPFVLVADRRTVWAAALGPQRNDALIGNQILDLVRRRVLGLRPGPGTITFRPGHDRPLLLVSGEGVPRSDTTRFSLRRARPRTAPEAFEPMLDFDGPDFDAAPPPPEPTGPAEPGTGTITFELPDEVRRVVPKADPDPMEIRTAGARAAAQSRRLRQNTRRAGQGSAAPAAPSAAPAEPEPPRGRTPPAAPPSLLDDEVPDFTLSAAALAAARAADEADAAAGRTRGTGDLQRAADALFGDSDVLDGETAAPNDKKKGRRRKNRTDGQDAAASAAAPAGSAAALRSRSLEIIERSERRRQRTVVAVLVLLLLLLLGVGGGVWWFLRSDLGARPSYKNYGTSAFDTAANSYLAKAAERRGVAGYLAFSGRGGQFVYPAGTVADDPSAEPFAVFAGESWLGSDAPSNTVLTVGGDVLSGLDTEAQLRENSGFTLYLPDAAYRFKVLAVYYQDSGEEDPALLRADLSSYYDYLSFVTGIHTRSLFDTGVAVGDGASFVTLTGASGEQGVALCVTGRLIAEGESAYLDPAAVKTAEEPLLTAAQYARAGREAPALKELLARQLNWYAAQSADAARRSEAAAQSGADSSGAADSSDLSERVDALNETTQQLIAGADELLAGLTDIAGQGGAAETDLNQGAEGGLPEQNVPLDSLLDLPAPTSAPTPSPTPTPTPPLQTSAGADSDSTAAQPTPELTPEPTPDPTAPPQSAAGETINVNMNGTPQTMDLVQCLAMVAQNELGPNAPAEAYKAQCVATHCWILSQGGYPSVLGQEPGAAALAAAQEVARVLVTYNGQVCFTPYFASASTGTASARDVWGSDRAWLQAVDSPYDQQVATNWNTNGNTSGSARFSRQTLQDRILDKMGVDLSGVDPNQWFTILSANEYGWVSQMQIGPNASGNDTCSGRWFREVLLARQSVDGRSLRSQCFTFTYDAGLDCFIFDVYGYGHGCGMSQWGAIGYARNGWDYKSILTHYYPGTTITTY